MQTDGGRCSRTPSSWCRSSPAQSRLTDARRMLAHEHFRRQGLTTTLSNISELTGEREAISVIDSSSAMAACCSSLAWRPPTKHRLLQRSAACVSRSTDGPDAVSLEGQVL